MQERGGQWAALKSHFKAEVGEKNGGTVVQPQNFPSYLNPSRATLLWRFVLRKEGPEKRNVCSGNDWSCLPEAARNQSAKKR